MDLLYFHRFQHDSAESLLLDGVVHVGQAAIAAVLAVEVGGHEDAGAALLARALGILPLSSTL